MVAVFGAEILLERQRRLKSRYEVVEEKFVARLLLLTHAGSFDYVRRTPHFAQDDRLAGRRAGTPVP